jgi:hypothetical protein
MSKIWDGLSIQEIWVSTHPWGIIHNMGIIIGRKEKVKRENLKRETRELVARQDWWKGLCAYRVPDACMSTLVGFIVGVWVVFGVVVSPIFSARIPVVMELVLGGVEMDHEKRISIFFAWQGTIVLLVTPAAVELSIWIGLFGWGHSIEMRVCLRGIISLAITKRAASSYLAADAIANLMIWAMERMAPLNRSNGLFSERRMCSPEGLQMLVSLKNPALEWAHRTMSLA